MDYTLTRSKRKTVAIHICDGSVEVRAPLKLSMNEIDKFVASKEKWIRNKLALSIQQIYKREKFTLNYGDTVLYRGKLLTVTAEEGDLVGVEEDRFFIPPGLTPEHVKDACVQIYRMAAKHELTLRTLEFAKSMPVKPSLIKINNAKSRWGSCSSKKSINYSWRLMMADDDVIDYVVAHELAHLLELNHSKMFWDIVEELLPDYREYKPRLKVLQDRLSGEDWD